MKLFDKLDIIFYGKHIMTEDEQEIDDIITKCLQIEGTDCKMNSHGKYYLFNKELHYYLIINENAVKLTNTKLSTRIKMNAQWYSRLCEKLNKWLDDDIESLEMAVFNSEMTMLRQISNVLDTTISVQSSDNADLDRIGITQKEIVQFNLNKL